jgi:hypothetical protein
MKKEMILKNEMERLYKRFFFLRASEEVLFFLKISLNVEASLDMGKAMSSIKMRRYEKVIANLRIIIVFINNNISVIITDKSLISNVSLKRKFFFTIFFIIFIGEILAEWRESSVRRSHVFLSCGPNPEAISLDSS